MKLLKYIFFTIILISCIFFIIQLDQLNTINQEPIEDDKENLIRISNIEGKINFKKVNFEYKKNNQVLKNINLEIKKGEVTAFVGASGAG